MKRKYRTILFAGIGSMVISALPWLGLGEYAFAVPGWDITLPRFDLVDSRLFYDIVAFPVQLTVLVPPLADLVYFGGEGRATVRPFAVFLFWFLLGTGCLWGYLRQKRRSPFDSADSQRRVDV